MHVLCTRTEDYPQISTRGGGLAAAASGAKLQELDSKTAFCKIA